MDLTWSIFFLKKYEVHGIYRKSSVGNTQNIDHLINDPRIFNKRFLHKENLLDPGSLASIINITNPNEIYNFADQDHVAGVTKFHVFIQATALSVDIFEILRKLNKKIKFFQPISSNIFGETKKLNKMKIQFQNRTVFMLWQKLQHCIPQNV